MAKVTQKDIKEFNELYLRIKTYSGVAKKTGFSPSTVKKYIIPGYKEVEKTEIKKFLGPLPDVRADLFSGEDWAPLCILSEEERLEIRELWEELQF